MHYRLSLMIFFMLLTSLAYCHVGVNSQINNYDNVAGNDLAEMGTNNANYTKAQTNGTVTDFEGNIYRTVTIGTQVWMAENLRATRFNDGTPIRLVTDDAEWSRLTTPAYCWYNNDSIKYGIAYGALYNWYATGTGKLCPAGWTVPTDADWTTLTNYLGGARIAGGKLKSIGTTQWRNPNLGATNESGFYALPAGTRYGHGAFNEVGNYTIWWTATQYDAQTAWFRSASSYDAIIARNYDNKVDGFSVRCVKK